MPKKKYPPHLYTNAVKKVCLSRVGRRNSGKKSVRRYVGEGSGPSKSTIYRWLVEKEGSRGPGPRRGRRGRKPRLSVAKKYVVGGWILHRGQAHKPSRAIHILSFVEKAFGQTFSPSWVTRLARELHLSSTPTSTKEEEVYKSFTFRWSPSLSERSSQDDQT